MDLMMIKCFLVVFLILEGTTDTAVSARNYTVGDSLGWISPPNQTVYSEWARNKIFFIEDTLLFQWNSSHHHNVAKVSEEIYNNCSTSTAESQIISTNSSFVYHITGNGSFYFICTVGNHCSKGQKLSIKVGEQNSESPESSPPSPSSFSALPPSPSSYALAIICFLGWLYLI